MGSRITFDYEVEGVEKTMRQIRRGIREGMEKAGQDLLERGRDAAQDRIMQRRRLWRHELYSSFLIEDAKAVSPTKVEGRILNYAPHGATIDEGRKPGETAPQVQHIIEWVDDKIISGYDLGDPTEPFPTSPLDTHSVLREDATIKEIVTGKEAGLSDSANSRDIRKVTYDDGDEGVFKPNDVSISETGVVENEEVVHRIAEKMDWTKDGGFPASRQRTITDIDGTEKTGNIQQFVDNPTEIGDVVKNYWNPDAGVQPEDFGAENIEWSARLGVIDYIVANDDRHVGNILIDGDGKPWAIDSGGHALPAMNVETRRVGRLVVFDEFTALDRQAPGYGHLVEDPERMYAVTNAILDRQEEIFRELRDSPDLRKEIIDMAESLHEKGTSWTGHYEDLLSDESTWRYALFKEDPDWGGKELWQHDIDIVREWLDDNLATRRPDLGTGDDTDDSPWWDNPMTLDDSDILAAIDKQLDYMVGSDDDSN